MVNNVKLVQTWYMHSDKNPGVEEKAAEDHTVLLPRVQLSLGSGRRSNQTSVVPLPRTQTATPGQS
jgi:hypothetical protein